MTLTEENIQRVLGGNRISDERAKQLLDVVKEIPKEQRTAGKVVELSEEPDHPLHDLFEWDNDVAAQKFREQQARSYLRDIKIEYKKSDGSVGRVRGLHAVTITKKSDDNGQQEDKPKRYVTVQEAKNSPDQVEQILEDCRRRVRQLVHHLRENEEYFDESSGLQRILDVSETVIEGEKAV